MYLLYNRKYHRQHDHIGDGRVLFTIKKQCSFCVITIYRILMRPSPQLPLYYQMQSGTFINTAFWKLTKNCCLQLFRYLLIISVISFCALPLLFRCLEIAVVDYSYLCQSKRRKEWIWERNLAVLVWSEFDLVQYAIFSVCMLQFGYFYAKICNMYINFIQFLSLKTFPYAFKQLIDYCGSVYGEASFIRLQSISYSIVV